MPSEPSTRIAIATAPNLRDIGGWPTEEGGRIRTGLVYRSAELNRLRDADLAAFAKLNVRTVFDLRTAAEATRQPDTLPGDTATVLLDVLADSSQAAPAELHQILDDPALAQELLGDGKAEGMMASAYRDMVSLPSALAAYGQLYSSLAEQSQRPALYHCTAGKDRTGWATAALLMLLGVPDEVVMEEYLLTNTELLPVLRPITDQFEQRGGDPHLLTRILGVQSAYLEAAVDEMRSRFGSVESYVSEGLGVASDAQSALRDALVEN
jgi:protein-tyrosine phosphatase